MVMISEFPRQAIPRSKKNKAWRESCVRFAENNTVLTSSSVRRSLAHKKINYDLYSGKIDMSDIEKIINPDGVDLGVPTPTIQHYPIINDKIMLLLGEEYAAPFDFRVVVTNPNSISEIEENKQKAVADKVMELVSDDQMSDEDFDSESEKQREFFSYKWQDIREIRANSLVNHYKKEQNFDAKFNEGFADALICNEEIYQCTIEGNEPVLRKLNPLKIRIIGGSFSNRIEDANMIVIEDYLDINTIIDRYGEYLSKAEIKSLEEYRFNSGDERGDKGDPRNYFRFGDHMEQISEIGNGWVSFNDGITSSNVPYDIYGNIRVLQVYWKSIRKIQNVKSYNPETGDAEFHLETEDYVLDENLGEESKVYYINEPWQGVMIGSGENAIFVDIKPCPVSFRRMENPSKCHFGIIGTIYNTNDGKPYSMIDMLKPLQYQYDVTHNKLNQMLARNAGKVIQLNASMIPAGWTMDKWLHYLKTTGIAVVDPMKEGTIGAAKGKLAGTFNMAPVIDTELGQSIKNMIEYLEYIKKSMYEIVGITPQRMGQVANRETVGGVERATLQSAHSTRWYFSKHNDLKKRVYECFIETAKACMKSSKEKNQTISKFQYITPDYALKLIDVPGDEFSECDYGLVVDSSYDMQSMNQEIQQIAQAAMQNQVLSFSTYLKIRSNCSMADKIRMIESEEKKRDEMVQQQQQQQMQLQQQANEMAMQQQQAMMQLEQMKIQQKETANIRDNQTKLEIAAITTSANISDNEEVAEEDNDSNDNYQFDEKMSLEREKLAWEKQKNKDNNDVKLQIARMKPKTTGGSSK